MVGMMSYTYLLSKQHDRCLIRGRNCLPFGSTWVTSGCFVDSMFLIFLALCCFFVVFFGGMCCCRLVSFVFNVASGSWFPFLINPSNLSCYSHSNRNYFHSRQIYVITCVQFLWQVGCFHRILQFSPPINRSRYNKGVVDSKQSTSIMSSLKHITALPDVQQE